ncbi:hypothetical protein [Rhizobium nepotum]|uniref:hypothetical protein n=1 Tax=Rhizobium nepotum TaxID=1035271 RepID=UPI003CFA566C
MDKWLKALVACACIVVIAGGAHYALGEYEAHQRSSDLRKKADREEFLKAAFSIEECLRMAKEALPDKKGQPARTTKYNDALSKCDDLNRFDANWRQALDMAGVF